MPTMHPKKRKTRIFFVCICVSVRVLVCLLFFIILTTFPSTTNTPTLIRKMEQNCNNFFFNSIQTHTDNSIFMIFIFPPKRILKYFHTKKECSSSSLLFFHHPKATKDIVSRVKKKIFCLAQMSQMNGEHRMRFWMRMEKIVEWIFPFPLPIPMIIFKIVNASTLIRKFSSLPYCENIFSYRDFSFHSFSIAFVWTRKTFSLFQLFILCLTFKKGEFFFNHDLWLFTLSSDKGLINFHVLHSFSLELFWIFPSDAHMMQFYFEEKILEGEILALFDFSAEHFSPFSTAVTNYESRVCERREI